MQRQHVHYTSNIDKSKDERWLAAHLPANAMNLALSNDHILDDYPEQVTHTLRSGHATCVKFNRKGDYLATGRHNGVVVVWDLDTMGVARKLRGHCYAVSSLSWSADGRYLLSTCQGWFAILWDLRDGSQHRQVRFNAPVFMAELNPLNQYGAASMNTHTHVTLRARKDAC